MCRVQSRYLLLPDDDVSVLRVYVNCINKSYESARASTAAAVDALDNLLAFLQLFAWHTANAIGAKVGVADLNTTQAAQVFIT